MIKLTFDSARDEDEAVIVDLPNVARVQPSLIINGLFSLLLVVQVAHEHVTTIHTNLQKNNQIQQLFLRLCKENSPLPLHFHQAGQS